MKALFKLCLLGLLVYYVPKFCNEKTEGFTIARIHSKLPFNPAWETSLPPKVPLEPIFEQEFSYLASGGQAYAFVSEDGEYVLKFFKQHHWGPFAKKKKRKKLFRDFPSYKIAYEELADQTGLLFLHLNKTDHLKQKVTLIDKLHIRHEIDLDKVEFILQKRAEPVYPFLLKLIEENHLEKAKEALDSLCEVIVIRSDKGIYDEDAKVHRNFGFVENRAVVFDVGRFKKDERRKDPSVQKLDLQKSMGRVVPFLAELSPELAQYLKEKLDD